MDQEIGVRDSRFGSGIGWPGIRRWGVVDLRWQGFPSRVLGAVFRHYWPPRTLKAQFLVYGTTTVVLAVALTTFLNVRIAGTDARRQVQSQVLHTATALASALERARPAQAQELLAVFHRVAGAEAGYQVVLVDPNGQIVAATDPRDIGKPIAEAVGHQESKLRRVLTGELPAAFDEMTHKGLSVLDVSFPLYGSPVDPGRITGALHLAVPYQTLRSVIGQRLAIFGLSVLLLAVLLIVPQWLYLERSLLRPLRILTAADEAVAAGRPEGRLIPPEAIPSHELGEAMRIRNMMLAQLEASSTELESYIYAISHDLRSPLSSIQGFSGLLAKECRATLGEEGSHYLDRIRSNTRQMGELIESLLNLSRVGRMSPSLTFESPARILEEIQEELSYSLEREKVRMIIDPNLPRIYCDRKGIRQVFVNLIGNAISAVKGGADPTIEVGYIPNGSSDCHFYVRDNGMGIDPIVHQEIFEPFQSFFSRGGKEGGGEKKGLGLAIVKQIVRAHRGEIWVESEPDKGASFHFTLPTPTAENDK